LANPILAFLESALVAVRLTGHAVLYSVRNTVALSITLALFAGVGRIRTGDAVEGVWRVHQLTTPMPVAMLHRADVVVRIALHTLGHRLLIAIAHRRPGEGILADAIPAEWHPGHVTVIVGQTRQPDRTLRRHGRRKQEKHNRQKSQ
jgi:hypothetical protein